ncbi:MAG TPA: response regulator, partial [Bacteroidota bacterium]
VELTFSVKDTGIGVPADKLDAIFEAFTQADSSVTRKYGGAGLGLVICSRLVGLMGGRIWVESTQGQGAKFLFTILANPSSEPETREASGGSTELNGIRVLIVDDNPTNLQVVAAECRLWGMVPVATTTPSEALEKIRNDETFALAIYDMQMPGKDGVELAKETRQLRDSRALPIILLSSWDLGDERIRNNAGLFAATVMKPLKMSQFHAVLKRVLAKNPATQQVPDKTTSSTGNLAAEIPLSILVAEDNLINQKLIQRMLRSMGYEPFIVGTGSEALTALDHRRYDLIFMDVQMPEMDGLEATQRIRRAGGGSEDPKIIAMTAFAMPGDKDKCLQAGMNDYLSKPFVSDQISSMIRKWGVPAAGGVLHRAAGDVAAAAFADADIDGRLRQLEQETELSFVKELAAIYLADAPENYRRFKESMKAGEAKSLEHLAHKLKGASMNLGAKKIAQLLESVEEHSRTGALKEIAPLAGAIDLEFERIVTYLTNYIATSAPDRL